MFSSELAYEALDAIQDDDPSQLTWCLGVSPDLIEWSDYDCYTLLHFAALYDSDLCVRELLLRGASVNARIEVGPPLGGCPNAGDDFHMRQMRQHWTPLDVAIYRNNPRIAQILREAGGKGDLARPETLIKRFDRRSKVFVWESQGPSR